MTITTKKKQHNFLKKKLLLEPSFVEQHEGLSLILDPLKKNNNM